MSVRCSQKTTYGLPCRNFVAHGRDCGRHEIQQRAAITGAPIGPKVAVADPFAPVEAGPVPQKAGKRITKVLEKTDFGPYMSPRDKYGACRKAAEACMGLSNGLLAWGHERGNLGHPAQVPIPDSATGDNAVAVARRYLADARRQLDVITSHPDPDAQRYTIAGQLTAARVLFARASETYAAERHATMSDAERHEILHRRL